jgi:hypothetical protein
MMEYNEFLKNISEFRYLGTAVTTKKGINVEIKRRLNSGNDC